MNKIKFIVVFMFSVVFTLSSFSQEKLTVAKTYTKQIKKLIKNKQVQKAFNYIELQDNETIQDMIDLTEILAPSFKEHKKALYFKKLLEKAGADKIWIDKEGNVIALRKGYGKNKKLFGFDAHLDVVFPSRTDVKVRRVKDTLKAPGIGDDTRGLSMIVSVLKAMNKAKIKTKNDILFVGTVGEEGLGDLRGMKYIFNKSGLKIDGWISIDGGSLGRINNAALGSKRYKIVLKGKGGHSWGAFGLANPHHAMGKVIDYFTLAASKYTSTGAKTSFNVGRIGGGTSVNSIPFESWAEIDMRSKSPKRLLEIEAIFKKNVKKAIIDYNATNVKYKLTYKLVKIGDRPSGELSTDLPLIQKAMAAVIAFGGTPRFTRGSTNASIPISKNIPAICIGRGGKAGGAHSLHEWFINDKSGVESIKLALLTLLAQAEF